MKIRRKVNKMDTNQEIIEDTKQFLLIMKEALKEAAELRYKKMQMYGKKSYETFGSMGVSIRVHDKLMRIINFYEAKLNDIENINATFRAFNEESVRDNFIDIINYSAMAVMLLDRDFKKLQDKTTTLNLDDKDNEPLPSFNIIFNEVFNDCTKEKTKDPRPSFYE
jgi:hypothetical protein